MQVSKAWLEAFPRASVGTLWMDSVRNPPAVAELDAALTEVEAAVRQRLSGFDRAALAALPTIAPYVRHYRGFGQTYHVLRQVESVALKGKPVASPGGVLVSAMFGAEVESHLLTAGHDLDAVAEPLEIDSSRDGDRFVSISGKELLLSAGDMLMRDRVGIISAVLHGPDQRTRLLPTTTRALFVTYAPEGIERTLVQKHLERIASLVQLAVPEATVSAIELSG